MGSKVYFVPHSYQNTRGKAKVRKLDSYDFSILGSATGKYNKKTINELENDARQHDKFAAYELGKRFQSQKHFKESFNYYLMAAKFGYTDAIVKAAWVAHERDTCKKALPLLEEYAKNHDTTEVHLLLGRCYQEGGSWFNGQKNACIHYRIAATRGNDSAQFLLFANDATDKKEQWLWLRCAQLNGNVTAERYIGRMIEGGLRESWQNVCEEVDREIQKHPEYLAERNLRSAEKNDEI